MAQVEIVYDQDDKDLQSLRGEIDPKMRQVAAALSRWVDQTRAVTNRSSLFDRSAYAAPDNIYDQMRIARQAVQNDDVVGGAAEITEAIALDGVKWEGPHPEEMDVFNQMAAEQDLDAIARRIWREEFTYSQVVHAYWWDWGEFTPRGETEKGNKRKKKYRVWYPRAVTTLDSTKVVPVGMLSFGQERLAWHATRNEIYQYGQVLDGTLMDEMMMRFYAGRYTPRDEDELQELTALGVDVQRLILLNDNLVKRHTLTRPDHERFADLRLKSVFRLLDLKQQLLESDRVMLIGAANYILLVKKGSKEDPAYPEEITNLRENFDMIAKLPVIFSDHRLEIEIVTPKVDHVLQDDKYDVLDTRIAARVLNSLVRGKSGERAEDSLKTGRLIARSMENRRHMIRRYLERTMAKEVYDHPRNAGVFEGEPPSMTFVPNRVQLDEDTGFMQQVTAARTTGDLSRETFLEALGFDQAVEAMRRVFEQEKGYDDIFMTATPYDSPDNNSNADSSNPRAQGPNGAKGGRPVGGGTPSKNPTKTAARSAKGTTKPTKASS